MKIYKLHRTQLIPTKLEKVFPFFENPHNLARITPPKMGFEIITPPPIKMCKGALINYVVNIMGLPARWTSLITEYNPPYEFVDEQIKGPYSFWHHRHLFKEVPEGTLIEDVIHYSLPFGFLGQLIEPLFVAPQLKGIFDYRQQVISSFFERNPQEGSK